MRSLLVSFLILCTASSVSARPVSYPGGWTVITENDGDENNALVHYTLTTHTAIGWRIAYDRATHETFNGIQMNNLLKRWNNPDSQANIYLKSAIGMAERPEGMLGAQIDWEDRRFMTSYENAVTLSPENAKRKFHQSFGLGIAPYLGESGELQTWIMPHLLYQSEDDKKWQFAPMLRFYKNTVLIEAGYNFTKSTPVANAMIRF